MAGAEPLALLVRFGLYVVLGVAFGLPLFTLYAPGAGPAGLRRTIVSTSIIGVALSIAGLLLLAASMAGIPAASVDRAAVEAILSLPTIGTAVISRIGALVLLAVAAFVIRRPRLLAVVGVACAGTALASLAWTGHGNISEGSGHPSISRQTSSTCWRPAPNSERWSGSSSLSPGLQAASARTTSRRPTPP